MPGERVTVQHHEVAELTVLMGDLVNDLRTAFERLAQRLDLTPPVANLLWQIDPDTPVAMRSAAERMFCDPSNVTFLADRLEEKGLVERRPNPTDRRVKLLVLTPEGEDLRARLLESAVDESPFVALDHDELGEFARMLGKVAQASATRRRGGSAVSAAAPGMPRLEIAEHV